MNPQTLEIYIAELEAKELKIRETAKAELKQLRKARRLALKTLDQMKLL